jgi:hypothetical protein
MRLARYGLAKLAYKPGDPPKRSKKSVRKDAEAQYSPENFTLQIAALLRVSNSS